MAWQGSDDALFAELAKFQLIANYRARLLRGARWQFQDDLRTEAEPDAIPRYGMHQLAHFAVLPNEYYVDGKLHAEGVDCLARGDEQALTRFQSTSLQ